MTLVADLEAAALAEHVGVDVVAVAGLARVDDGPEGARRESQGERRGVPIAVGAELGGAWTEGGPGCPDLLDLHPGEEARHVDVVDGHVDELTATAPEVLR